jgi:hypothetical protein
MDAIETFVNAHPVNTVGTFLNMVDNPPTDDAAYAALASRIHTDSDVDDIVDEIDQYLENA